MAEGAAGDRPEEVAALGTLVEGVGVIKASQQVREEEVEVPHSHHRSSDVHSFYGGGNLSITFYELRWARCPPSGRFMSVRSPDHSITAPHTVLLVKVVFTDRCLHQTLVDKESHTDGLKIHAL